MKSGLALVAQRPKHTPGKHPSTTHRQKGMPMTPGADVRVRFAGPGSGVPVYLPELTLWHKWHSQRGTLPVAWQGCTLPQIAEALGVPAWIVERPWRVRLPGIEVVTEEAAAQRTVQYRTSAGRSSRVLTGYSVCHQSPSGPRDHIAVSAPAEVR